MNVVNGLPAHVLFVHFMVVLAPLTALSEVACALWPAARHRLVWPMLALALVTTVLTPITTNAGAWLFNLRTHPTAILREHADRGSMMIYFSVAMLVVAILLVALHLMSRSDKPRTGAKVIVAILALAVGISSMVQVYRIGDIGSQSVWGGEIQRLEKTHGQARG